MLKHYGYAAVLVGVVGEGLGIPVPAETLLVAFAASVNDERRRSL